ncbi:MAG TPA: DUF192 domain-containing protein [Polyangiaceae bacterium]|nr:DUF192 domain-containing protein [Polyangiaceae bacterium]
MRVWMLALVATLAAECTRAPSEDFPTRPVGPSTVPAAASTVVAPAEAPAPDVTGRCLLPTPEKAPAALPPGPAAGCPVDPEGGPPKVPVVHVGFPDARPGGGVDAELVSSPHDTERGLMYRKSMPEDHGMLFDLRVRDEHPFWMHNTCIPLDLLHIDDDGVIVGILESAPTLNDASRTVGCPSRYVLEVNAGWSRRHGVKAGQHMTIPPEAR